MGGRRAMNIERWLPIPGFDGRYDISDAGVVHSWVQRHPFKTSTRSEFPRVMGQRLNQKGYPVVVLRRSDGHSCTTTVHKLVALVFLGPRPDGLETRHLDGNPLNSSVTNLVYGTRSENMLDKIRHGRHHNVNKTHCPQGHLYDEQNTRVSNSQRHCRACARLYQAARRERYRRSVTA
jgi:hypothetical protein